MIDKYTALGLRGTFGKESDFKPAILTREFDPWPIGTPGVIYYPEFEAYKDRRARMNFATLMYGTTRIAGMGQTLTPYNTKIKTFGKADLIDSHRVLEIEHFEPEKARRLIEYVKDVGSVSLLIEGELGQRSFLNDLRYLINEFRYHTASYVNITGLDRKFLMSEGDKRLTLITLLDIPYCSPIFNFKRVDGIGLLYRVITKDATLQYGAPHALSRLDLLLTNYEDNIFIMDGEVVCGKNKLSTGLIVDLQSVLMHKLSIKNDEKLKEPRRPHKITELKTEDQEWKVSNDNGPTLYYHGNPTYTTVSWTSGTTTSN